MATSVFCNFYLFSSCFVAQPFSLCLLFIALLAYYSTFLSLCCAITPITTRLGLLSGLHQARDHVRPILRASRPAPNPRPRCFHQELPLGPPGAASSLPRLPRTGVCERTYLSFTLKPSYLSVWSLMIIFRSLSHRRHPLF